jgi:hypothetical protein
VAGRAQGRQRHLGVDVVPLRRTEAPRHHKAAGGPARSTGLSAGYRRPPPACGRLHLCLIQPRRLSGV